MLREEIRALEVVWSPAEEADRLSSYELEKLYPELVRTTGAPTPERIG